ncbi:hypothetical protein TRVL_09122 [Trypanosoma vivax]|nr:hypothetical protein TRVL_09122 [Trypanosoma vivax]
MLLFASPRGERVEAHFALLLNLLRHPRCAGRDCFTLLSVVVAAPWCLLCAQHVVLTASRLCAVAAAVWLLTCCWSCLGGVPLLVMSTIEYATAQLCVRVFARHYCNTLRISL